LRAPRSVISPARIAPISGRKTIAEYIPASALHHVDVLDLDRAAVAEEDDQDRQADGGLGSGDGEDEKREDLADEIAEMRRKRPKLILTASSISSTDIRMTMTFLRLMKMPKMPIVNRIAATAR